MAKTIMIDEIHVTVFARHGLREATYDAMQRTLRGRRFLTELKTSVRAVFRKHSALSKTKIKVER